MNKPTLRDRRRTEAREALYRATLRRDQILDSLVANYNRIKKLKAQLARLEKPVAGASVELSVAEGKLLDSRDPTSIALVLNDEIPDLSGRP